jgi:DNA-binding NarL/FixJ family response regulator
MQQFDVVLLQSDFRVAQSLVSALWPTVGSVREVNSLGELRTSIAKHRAEVAILDLEKASISDVQYLAQEFPGACIVCTHRCADEEMWAAALNAGASDVCPADDTQAILRAALGSCRNRRAAAA